MDVLEARGVEVLHRADRRVVVGVALGEERGVDVDERVAVGLVVVPLALLLLDDVALVVEVLLRHGVEEVAVPVGLEPEGELDGPGGDGLEVVGAVEPRRRVEPAALGHQRLEVLAAAHVARALEHQVLEEVREAGATGRLVARPDPDPEVHRDVRDGVVGAHDDPQPVGQRAAVDGVVQRHGGHPTSARRRPTGGSGSAGVLVPGAPAVPFLELGDAADLVVAGVGGDATARRRASRRLHRPAAEDLLLGGDALGAAPAEEADRPVQQRGDAVLEADDVDEVDRRARAPRRRTRRSAAGRWRRRR